jgi:adhesin/invasin
VTLVAVASAATSTVGVSPSSIPADGSTVTTVTVTVRDLNGDLIGVGGDTVTMASDLGTLGAVADNGDGTYSAVLSGTVAGDATVSFAVNGVDAASTAAVTLIAVPAESAPPVAPVEPAPAPAPAADLASTGIDIGTGAALVGLLVASGLIFVAFKRRRVGQS